MTPEKPKRTIRAVHGRDPRPQFHEKTPSSPLPPEREEKKRNLRQEREKKARNVGPPFSPLFGPHPFASPPPHPTFGPPTLRPPNTATWAHAARWWPWESSRRPHSQVRLVRKWEPKAAQEEDTEHMGVQARVERSRATCKRQSSKRAALRRQHAGGAKLLSPWRNCWLAQWRPAAILHAVGQRLINSGRNPPPASAPPEWRKSMSSNLDRAVAASCKW